MGSAVFTPASLFASGEQGGWYDPSDLTSMWQDSAGTTPAAVNSPVGKINDKSGRGNHFTQATTAAKPILRQSGALYYLEFDGVDDWIASTAVLPLTANDNATVALALEMTSATGMVIEHSTSADSNNGTYYVYRGGSTTWRPQARGTVTSNPFFTVSAVPDKAVYTNQFSISGDVVSTRRNKASVGTGAGDQGTGNFGSYQTYLGARAGSSLFSAMKIYGVVIRGALTADPTALEDYLAAKSGAY